MTILYMKIARDLRSFGRVSVALGCCRALLDRSGDDVAYLISWGLGCRFGLGTNSQGVLVRGSLYEDV